MDKHTFCETCGRLIPPEDIGGGRPRRFCSRKCLNAHYNKVSPSRRSKGPKTLTCRSCGVQFTGHGNRKTCGAASCRKAYQDAYYKAWYARQGRPDRKKKEGATEHG